VCVCVCVYVCVYVCVCAELGARGANLDRLFEKEPLDVCVRVSVCVRACVLLEFERGR